MKIKKIVISCENEAILKKICGQQPSPIFAKKSIANFAIRENQLTGFFVTLRKKRLVAFMERFCRVILPSQSRFQGFQSEEFTKANFTIGLPDSIAFLELSDNTFDFGSKSIGLSLSFFTDIDNSIENKKVPINDFLKDFGKLDS